MSRRAGPGRGRTVRCGTALAHVQAVGAARILFELDQLQLSVPRAPLAAATGAAKDLGLARASADLCAAAREVVVTFGGRTLAQGLAQLRACGRRPRWSLVRELRTLDGAWSLLRHPGAAAATLARARAWLAEHPQGEGIGDATSDGGAVESVCTGYDTPDEPHTDVGAMLGNNLFISSQPKV